MNQKSAATPETVLLALLAYQNLCVAESLFGYSGPRPELSARLPLGRLGAEVLSRFTRMCDAIPGGQQAALAAIQPLTSPVDEFVTITTPKARGERMLRLLFVTHLELELIQRLRVEELEPAAAEAIGTDAGLWQVIDHTSLTVLSVLGTNQRVCGELSTYVRRMLGEAAVVGQRLLVREPALRVLLTGDRDDQMTRSSAALGELLSAVSARLSQLGLSM